MMAKNTYALPPGGVPPQDEPMEDTAIFTDAYAVIPHQVMRDIVTSYFPNWQKTRAWVLARPLSGFAETFSQTIMEIDVGGGSEDPDNDPDAQSALFVVDGELDLTFNGERHTLRAGGFAYLAPNENWSLHNHNNTRATFHWIRKRYEPVTGLLHPRSFVTSDDDETPQPMAHTDGAWRTTRFIDPDDLAHDMHVNIVSFSPGARIPFAETHVMEHGLYMLEGEASYRLNTDWVNVKAGDFLWLRAFCPQACIAGGEGPFRYLLYKDVNRLPKLRR